MNKDLIFDAMDYIDDDMLEEVDALRMGGATKRGSTWMRCIPAAACILGIMGGIIIADKYGLTVADEAVKDDAVTEMSDEKDLVHNYSSVQFSISESGAVPKTITDPEEVTAVYDILRLLDVTAPGETDSETNADDYYFVADEAEEVDKTLDDKVQNIVAPESVTGDSALMRFTIVLVSSDGGERVYYLSGRKVTDAVSGESGVLRAEQYSELVEILNGK